MSAPFVIAVFGPTGVGKTGVAIELAQRLRARGEDPAAVSADALQLYAGLEVLTAAPGAEERDRLEHRLVGVLPVDATCSAGEYAALAHAEIDALLARGRRPIVVGGTGLYLRAALTELDLRPPPPASVRRHWNAELERLGARGLHAVLTRRDAVRAAAVAPTDSQRIVRSLELLDTGAEPLLAAGRSSQLWAGDTRHPTLLAGIVMERSALYARIDARVDEMAGAGAVGEVRTAQATASPTARKALGFEELLSGDVDAMKRRTRNYAKRQLTWMRKLPGVVLLDATGRSSADVAAELDLRLQSAEAAGKA